MQYSAGTVSVPFYQRVCILYNLILFSQIKQVLFTYIAFSFSFAGIKTPDLLICQCYLLHVFKHAPHKYQYHNQIKYMMTWELSSGYSRCGQQPNNRLFASDTVIEIYPTFCCKIFMQKWFWHVANSLWKIFITNFDDTCR